MADFNKILDAGDVDGGIINVVVEIPTGSSHKIEWNRELAVFELDRIDPQILLSLVTMVLFHKRLTKMVMSLMR